MNGTEDRGGTIAPPVDIATMRATVARVLPPEATPTDRPTLETLTGLLRGHMQLLIPEIENAAVRLPADGIPRYCALACVGEARGKLNAGPGLMPYDPVAHVRRLGRSLRALCDHYEALTGVRTCAACDQPIMQGEVGPSEGAAFTGRVHDHCASAVRAGSGSQPQDACPSAGPQKPDMTELEYTT